MACFNLTTLGTIFMLLISLSAPTNADYDNAVLDTNGDALIAGAFYYAIPITESQTTGGLTMFNNDSASCPEFIVSPSNYGPQDFGIPLVFFPEITEQTTIVHGSPDYNIAFKSLSILPECRRLYTTVWTVSTEASTGSTLVVLDGEKGDQSSWFKIEHNGGNDGYKIRYSSTSIGGSMSKDVGIISNEQGVALLSVDDAANPLVVVFLKY